MAITLAALLALTQAEEAEFFEKKIRPILTQRCYACHSVEGGKRKGGLLLDSREGWKLGGDSGMTIMPGEPDRSLLIKAVRYTDPDLQMPPKRKLPPTELAALELWVAQGAFDPRTGGTAAAGTHAIDLDAARKTWTYSPPVQHPAPEVKDEAWPLGELDRFILAKLESRKLKPAPDVDRRTLIRRLSFDLVGLPPSPEEIDAFLADPDPGAITRAVDRLLSSDRFGEHWGRRWLDVARYADTNGSDFNATYFNAWKYRDYVIAAFNDDLPFDRFVREQLAGDLISENDPAAVVATGFLMVGAKMLSERDKDKLRMDVIDEQLDTVGKAFMALSLGCARCHDHKFDPIPQADYYALAGIFGSTDTIRGEIQQYVSDWVRRELPVPGEHRAEIDAFRKASDRLKKEIAAVKKRHDAVKKKIVARKPVRPGIVVDDAEAVLKGKWRKSTYTPRYVGMGYIHDNKEEKGKRSATFTPDLPEAGEYEVRISYPASGGRDEKVPVRIRHAGGETNLKINQVTMPPIEGLFDPVGRFRFEKGRKGSVTISTEGTTEYVIADAVHFIPVNQVAGASAAGAAEPSPEHLQAAVLHKELLALERKKEDLEKNPPKAVPVALAVEDARKPADERLCIRGVTHHRAAVVPRGFLRACSPRDDAARLKDAEGSGRLEFARWLTRPDHPLTARVFVNRAWYHLLGEGIVRTVDNFGERGEAPSHPDLLDRLAVDFVKDGWSPKRLIRRIVLSRTYRMSSGDNEAAFAVDPENRLLWRAHRRRLPAEAIRDAMLAVGDRLDLEPSVNAVATFKKLAVDNGTGQWSGKIDEAMRLKRSVYQPIVRGAIPELMTLFDFADPDRVVGRRPSTTVPAQALLLMNSTFVRECAEAAERRLPAGAKGVDRAFLLTLGRPPRTAERRAAREYIERESGEGVAEGAKDAERRKRARARCVQALLASTEFRMLD